MLWASFPPLGLWPLAWVALAPWLALVRKDHLGFRRPYRAIYSVGLLTWLATIQWVRLPHPSAYFGWLALAMYLAIYVPLFVGFARVAVHSLRIPLWIAGPVVWTGLEAVRSWLFTGFGMMLLGHSQVSWISIIQVSDIGGPHAVSFLIVMVGALLLNFFPGTNTGMRVGDFKTHDFKTHDFKTRWHGPALATIVLLVTVLYGTQRIGQTHVEPVRVASVALIQGSVDITFSPEDDPQETFNQYLDLSRNALSGRQQLPVLVVWPESMFSGNLPYFTGSGSFLKPADETLAESLSDAEFQQAVRTSEAAFFEKTKWVASELGTPLLVGTETIEYGPTGRQQFNSALWIDEAGGLVARYDKMHPVMFGEYVPFSDWLPILNRLTPMRLGLSAGETPIAVQAGELTLSPSICFENTVAHLIRRQINELESGGATIDGLVTITNDGWFWGSDALDMHLACGIFRAVENRRSMVIAANTGFSAHIDQTGKVQEKGPRRETGVVFASVQRVPLESFYTAVGDWLGTSASLFCLFIAMVGWQGRRRIADAVYTGRR